MAATHSSVLSLENPMDRGTWKAIVHKVAQSRTPLKRPSMHARKGVSHAHVW